MAGRVLLTFPSQEDGSEPVAAASDRAGRFCILWPAENAATRIDVDARPVRGPRDARVVRLLAHSSHRTRVRAVIVSDFPSTISPGEIARSDEWKPSDARRDCVEPGVDRAWHNVEGVEDNWRVRLVQNLTFAALVCLALAVAVGRTNASAPVFWVAVGVSVTASAAFALVWGPVL